MVVETLSEWNHWWREKKVEPELSGEKRQTLKELKEFLSYREIKSLLGIRRCGKSTLFYQLIEHLLSENTPPEDVLLINFEDDVLSKKTLKEIYDTYQSNINPDTKPYLFLDEVHRCSEWVLFLRKLYDLKKVKQIYITDSSSKFIKSEYASVLTGRNIGLTVFPLSFKEYLEWKKINFKQPLAREEINKIKNELFEFLKWGGFPEVFYKPGTAKKILLTEYFGDIIHKDIVERYNVNYSKIKPLADFLVSNSTLPFSPRKYSRTYGLSLESINSYTGYFSEVFLFYFIPMFSYSLKSQQLSQKKPYICDNGFFNNLGFRFTENIGRVYENAVFLELKRRGKEVYYWKDKHECDFLIKDRLEIKEAIQVCCKLTEENREREIKGLEEALEKFNLNEGLIITADYEKEESSEGKKIKFIPLWRWLLELPG